MKERKFRLPEEALRIILIVIGSIFSCLVLIFVSLAIREMQNSNINGASLYLFGIFIVLGLSRFVTFLKERTEITFLRFLILFVLDVGLGIIIVVAKNSPYLYQLCGGLYCITIILSRVFKIIQNHTLRSIITNAIIIAFASVLAIALFVPNTGSSDNVVIVICVIVALSAFVEVISNASSTFRAKTFFQIILKTYALEIIMGLLTTMVAFSLILMMYEEDIPTFADGLWYTFAVVTTIGFGDFVAKTLIGRIITVILGIYGIVVVAVITSIIVNFYTEISGKRDKENLKELTDDIKKERRK